jgi:uncharacterized membrane protein
MRHFMSPLNTINFVRQTAADLDAHHRFLIALGIGITAYVMIRFSNLDSLLAIVLTWDIYAITLVTLAWISILLANPKKLRQNTTLQDTSSNVIFFIVLISACASLSAVTLLLRTVKDEPIETVILHLVLSVAAVIVSWILIHTLFTIRYAHFYFTPLDHKAIDPKNTTIKNSAFQNQDGGDNGHHKGLIFPETHDPDYLDFAYFSFVIGMTAQVSDVQVSSGRIRRLVLFHSVLSFAFNTIIVALSINISSQLI